LISVSATVGANSVRPWLTECVWYDYCSVHYSSGFYMGRSW